MILIYLIIIIVCFYFMARICDEYFIESLDKIAKRFKMPSDVAGATLMAVGSSAPELFIAIIALVKPGDHAALGMGTIVGSAIFNVLVIIGVAAIVRKAILSWQPIIRDSAFYIISVILLFVFFQDGTIILEEAFIFVVLYAVYIIAVMNWKKVLPYKNIISKVEKEIKKEQKKRVLKDLGHSMDFLLQKIFPHPKHYYAVFSLSILFIALLSWVLVESAVQMAHILHISEAIIALTVLAAGTSIPDMISSVIVAKQGKGGMAISNALGSNNFDILFGLGVPWFVLLIFAPTTMIAVNNENLISSVLLLLASIIVALFLMAVHKWKLGRYSGLILVILYLGYLSWAISRVI